jgi:putative serine protease PepD
VLRPWIDPAEAAAFARPSRVQGPFDPVSRNGHTPAPVHGPEVPEILVDAFGRPPGSDQTLGRPPHEAATQVQAAPADPWRNPATAVVLGAPAEPEPVPPAPTPVPAEKFTLRQALFERRLRPAALAGLLAMALVIGLAGAMLGVLLGSRVPAAGLDPSFTLATAQPAVQRPVGSVAGIAHRVVPAVVSLEVRTGDTGDAGSGFVISADGYILTNDHVVSLAASDPDAVLTVVFNDGKGTRVPGTIVGRDPMSDLAVVKVDVDNLTVAQLGDSSALQVGDEVIAVGSPLGLAGTVTTGIVSSIHRPVHLSGQGTDTDAVIDAIQTDAAINPGNSGGPLVDATGAVVGINTAIRTLGGGGETSGASGSIGLGFAIPIDYARSIAQTLIAHGTVTHPTIGVNARSATDGTTDGAQVQNVADGGPAAKAGISEGDVIVRVGDRSVGSADELVVAVQQHRVGDTVPVELLRDGKKLTVQVTLAAG